MKSYIIITASALATGALASAALNAHEIENLVAREIDPKTMDPTRLSVLSVLKTAIPSGSDFPLPTGDFEPEWFSKLPADVKSLLPSLYPAAAVVTASEASSSAFTSASSSAVLSATTAELATSAVSSAVSSAVHSVVSASASLPLSDSQLTVTKTLQHASSATGGYAMPSSGSSTTSGSTNGTLATVTPLPSGPLSNGAKGALGVEKLAAIACVGFAAGLFLFA